MFYTISLHSLVDNLLLADAVFIAHKNRMERLDVGLQHRLCKTVSATPTGDIARLIAVMLLSAVKNKSNFIWWYVALCLVMSELLNCTLISFQKDLGENFGDLG